MLVQRLNGYFDCGHKEQLCETSLAYHSTERDKHSGRTKIGNQKSI